MVSKSFSSLHKGQHFKIAHKRRNVWKRLFLSQQTRTRKFQKAVGHICLKSYRGKLVVLTWLYITIYSIRAEILS